MAKEYIPREAAMPDGFCVGVSCQECPFCDDPIKGGCKVARFIDAVPAAAVVEVVRCGDCKHYNAGFECLIEGYGIERPADYFCADGERKDGGQDDAEIH